MKYLSIFLWMCCSAITSLGQELPTPVVAATRLNVVYAGIENPISIAVPEFATEDLVVEVDGVHQLLRHEDGWILIPSLDSSRLADIKVSKRNDNGEHTELGTVSFRVKRIPDPTLEWGGARRNGEGISKAVLNAAPPIRAIMENFDFEVWSRIVSFDLTYYRNDVAISLTSNSRDLTEPMRQAMRNFDVGDAIYIENAIATMPDGTTRTLDQMRVFVVE